MSNTDPTNNTTQKTKKMANTDPPTTQHRKLKDEQHRPHQQHNTEN